MKKIVALFLFLTFSLMACTGDCLTCHPSLEKNILTDLRHKPMLSCINCHSAVPSSMAECGSDCFACHPMEKINNGVLEHEVIQECKDCHVKMKQELLDITKTLDQSHVQEPLRDFLLE
ncbi:MAG: hypothetical protein PF439_03355 [Helicobacteraceae bacterium]|jgi:hypothetical protein|nr:hypothetical protein [Helicobacteraceae bacterium]